MINVYLKISCILCTHIYISNLKLGENPKMITVEAITATSQRLKENVLNKLLVLYKLIQVNDN